MRVSFLVRRSGERWRVPTTTAYRDEVALQMLLKDAPELLPGDDDRRPAVVADEFPVRFGRVDLVGVARSGAITVVECKLQANPDIRRNIVGQLFAYASALWELSYEQFDQAWRARTGSSLLEDVAKGVADHELDWDRDSFSAAVTSNLEAGRFTLVVAVDEITPELQRIIEYLSAHTDPGVDVVALELGYAEDGDLQVLIPQAFGVEMAERKASATGPRPLWDETRFFDVLMATRDEAEVAVARQLFGWAQVRMPRIFWTSGAQSGSFIPGLEIGGVVHNTLVVNSRGRLIIPFDYMASRAPFTDAALRAQFASKLSAAGFPIRDGSGAGSPSITLGAFVAEDALGRLLAALDWAVDTILRDTGDQVPTASA